MTISHTGYIDTAKQSMPVKSAQVVVGTTAGVSFQYDKGATSPSPTTTRTRAAAVAPQFPRPRHDLPQLDLGHLPTQHLSASVLLHPFTSGYKAVAGPRNVQRAHRARRWTPRRGGAEGGASSSRPGCVARQSPAPRRHRERRPGRPMGVVSSRLGRGLPQGGPTGPGPGASKAGCKTDLTFTFGPVLKNGTVAWRSPSAPGTCTPAPPRAGHPDPRDLPRHGQQRGARRSHQPGRRHPRPKGVTVNLLHRLTAGPATQGSPSSRCSSRS